MIDAIPGQGAIDFRPRDFRVGATEAKRLSQQCAKILARLQLGPATNVELAQISIKYGARISDIRAAGFSVVCYERNHETGVCRYKLAMMVPK